MDVRAGRPPRPGRRGRRIGREVTYGRRQPVGQPRRRPRLHVDGEVGRARRDLRVAVLAQPRVGGGGRRGVGLEPHHPAAHHEQRLVRRRRQRLHGASVHVDVEAGAGPAGVHAEARLAGDDHHLDVQRGDRAGERPQRRHHGVLGAGPPVGVGHVVADEHAGRLQCLGQPRVQRVDQHERPVARLGHGGGQVERLERAPVRRAVGAVPLDPRLELLVPDHGRRDDHDRTAAGLGPPRR